MIKTNRKETDLGACIGSESYRKATENSSTIFLATKYLFEALLIFERKIFRRICGSKYANGEWKDRKNRELEEMSKGENIVKWTKGQRISWLDHLERMEGYRMPKKIFTQELEGREEGEDPGKGGKRK